MKREGLSSTQLNSLCPAWVPSPYQSFPHLLILPSYSRPAPLFLCLPSLLLAYSPLSSLFPLLTSSANCSLNPVRVRLQLTLPQLHMSILPPPLLLLYSAWDGAASPLEGDVRGMSRWSRGERWALPGTQLWRTELSLPHCRSFPAHLVRGGTGPCYAVLFCPWLSMVAAFWPGYAGVGLDFKCGSAHCCTHTDEPGLLVSHGYWTNRVIICHNMRVGLVRFFLAEGGHFSPWCSSMAGLSVAGGVSYSLHYVTLPQFRSDFK